MDSIQVKRYREDDLNGTNPNTDIDSGGFSSAT